MTPRRWVALSCVLLLLAVMFVPTGKAWLDQRQRLNELSEQVTAQEESVADLKREKELWETDGYVESQARQRLKFVKPGERTYTIVDPESDSAEIDPETGTVTPTSKEAWYEQMASSVRAADDPALQQ